MKEKVINKILDLIEKNDNLGLQVSLRENLEHVYIGDNVAVADDGKIIISGSFTDPDVLNLAHQTVDYLERWVNDYVDFNIPFSKMRLKIRNGTILRHFDIKDLDYERLEIRINHKSIIDLISSNAIWRGNSMVVKELLQTL